METSPTSKPEWKPLEDVVFEPGGCPVCGSADGRPLHRKKAAGFDMEYWLCNRCNALYTKNRASTESLRGIYSSKGFFAAGQPGDENNIDYFDFIGGEKYLRLTARGRVSRIRKFRPSGKLLEVASAAGFFLIEAKEAGYDVSGVEFSAPMAKYASDRWQVPVVGDSIELIELPERTYDVIVSWGVLTILQDPIRVFRKFHRALKHGGIWAFNTYYHDCLWHKLVGGRWQILGVQTSQIYSRQQILDLVSREGFKLLSRRRDVPHTDLLKVADQLVLSTGCRWLPQLVQKLGIQSLIIRLPLPDVYEYIWEKT